MAWTILDGYNLMFRESEPDASTDLEARREEFLRRVDSVRLAGQRVTVVFDGPAGTGASSRTTDGLQVIYSGDPKSADDRIVALVSREPKGSVTVLTHDRELAHRVRSAGGRIGDPAGFFRKPRLPGRRRPREKPPAPSTDEVDLWERLFRERDPEDPKDPNDRGDPSR